MQGQCLPSTAGAASEAVNPHQISSGDAEATRGTPDRPTGSTGSEAGMSLHSRNLSGGNSEALGRCLAKVLQWDFDCFELFDVSQGRPLFHVAKSVYEREGMLEGWNIDSTKLEEFLTRTEALYGSNPYHNSTHAADVVQATYVLIKACTVVQFTKLEVFAMLVAAAVHDLDHSGLTNSFLISSGHVRAQKAGSPSVNESHHLACCFQIAADTASDIFSGLDDADNSSVRSCISQLVMSTDMAQHHVLLSQVPAAAADGAQLRQHQERIHVMSAILHTADLSNPCRPVHIAARWGQQVCSEMVAQGDLERTAGMAVTPACDRETVVVSTSQLFFINGWLRPLLARVEPLLNAELLAQLWTGLSQTEAHWRQHEELVQAGLVDALQAFW